MQNPLSFQVQKRRRLNGLNTVVSLLRVQLKISATLGTSSSSATQPPTRSAAGDANQNNSDTVKVTRGLTSVL